VYLPAEQALARWQIENGEAASGLVTAHNALRIVAQRNDTVLVVPHLLLEVCRAEVALGDLTEAAVAAAQAAELVDGAVDPGALPRRIAQVGSQLAPRDADVPHEGLSRRELEVLVLLPSELSAAEIASELFVSPNTARSHIKSIHRKLGVTSRAEAVAAARRAGLIA